MRASALDEGFSRIGKGVTYRRRGISFDRRRRLGKKSGGAERRGGAETGGRRARGYIHDENKYKHTPPYSRRAIGGPCAVCLNPTVVTDTIAPPRTAQAAAGRRIDTDDQTSLHWLPRVLSDEANFAWNAPCVAGR